MFDLFDIEREVKKTLREALLSASKITGVELLKVRIKICSPSGDGKLHFHVMDGLKQVTTYDEDKESAVFADANGKKTFVNLRTLLDISVDLFGKEKMYGNLLGNVVANTAFKHEIPLKDADFRVYTHDERIKEKNWLANMEAEMQAEYETMISEDKQLVNEGKKFLSEWIKMSMMIPKEIYERAEYKEKYGDKKFDELSVAQVIEAGNAEGVITEMVQQGG